MPKINLLNPSFREGEHETQSILVPNDVAPRYTVTIDIRSQDLSDPTFFCSLDLYVSDNDVDWEKNRGMTVIGGVDDWAEPPSLSIRPDKAGIIGKYLKLIININQRTRMGLDIEDEELHPV